MLTVIDGAAFGPARPMSESEFRAALRRYEITLDPFATRADAVAHALRCGIVMEILR